MTPQAMVAGSIILGTVILVPLAFVAESPLSLNPSIEAISAMVAIGALTGTGFSVYFLVMRRVGANVHPGGRRGAGRRRAGGAAADGGIYWLGTDLGGRVCCQYPGAGQTASFCSASPEPPATKLATFMIFTGE